MWVPKTPRPGDFCGCPPCPICFDWADTDEEQFEAMRALVELFGGTVRTEKNMEARQTIAFIPGVVKMTVDLVGTAVPPTPAQVRTLVEAAERIHVGNLAKLKARPDGAFFHEEDDKQFTERQVEAFLAQKRREAAFPKRVRTTVCDHLDMDKYDKAAVERAEQQEKIKEKEVRQAVVFSVGSAGRSWTS